MSYSTDPIDGLRYAGIYVAKILNGAKLGDLPIEQASKFTFVINLKTAKALGIVVPPTLLAVADEVIE
jgi:putative ABC transport system substrate-binding protein